MILCKMLLVMRMIHDRLKKSNSYEIIAKCNTKEEAIEVIDKAILDIKYQWEFIERNDKYMAISAFIGSRDRTEIIQIIEISSE